MSSQKLDQQEELKNLGRRSRKDEQGRDYVCGCGKSYLSYPALYTHIKTKHEGNRPEGTYKIGYIGQTGVAKKAITSSPNDNADVPNAYTISQGTNNRSSKLAEVKSQLDAELLAQIQAQVKTQDLRILVEMDQTAQGFTNPDHRILRQNAGQVLYDKYEWLVRSTKQTAKPTESLGLSQIAMQFTNLTGKSELSVTLVSYLLAVGRHVSEGMMQYYAEFASMFLECFTDHVEEIYEVMYKDALEASEQKQRHRDYKMYEYSYLPSSSKAKTYNTTQNLLAVNNKQVRYSPIISEFFIRAFVPRVCGYDYYVSIIKLICCDFCTWLNKKKYSFVDVSLSGKYELLRGDLINVRERETVTDRKWDGIDHVDIDAEAVDRALMRDGRDNKEKTKRRERQKLARSPLGGKTVNRSKEPKAKKPNPDEPREFEELHNGEQPENSDNAIINQEFYKIDPEIAHQSAGRDRSGSIHLYMNEPNFEPEPLVPLPVAEENVNQEQIEQYFSIHKP